MLIKYRTVTEYSGHYHYSESFQTLCSTLSPACRSHRGRHQYEIIQKMLYDTLLLLK
jgi:hypothetical protein